MAEYLEWAPIQWRMHVLFGTFFAMLVGGYFCRSIGLITKQDTEGLRKFVFNVSLPAMLFVNMWKMQLSIELIHAIPWCVVVHVLWASLAHVIHAREDPIQRPWYVLTAQGTFLGYLYPFAAAAGPKVSAAIMVRALVWDLGGNMWLCLFWIDFIVRHLVRKSKAFTDGKTMHAERPQEENRNLVAPETPLFGDAFGKSFGRHRRSHSHSGDLRSRETVRRHLKTNGMGIEELDVKIRAWLPRRKEAFMMDMPVNLSDFRTIEHYDCAYRAVVMCRTMVGPLKDILRPIPAAAIAGLALNVIGLPCHPWIDGFVSEYAQVFTPGMFTVMGCFITVDFTQISRHVGRAVLTRCAINLIITMVILVLPVSPVTHYTWILSAWSPMTSWLIVLTFEYGFDEAQSVTTSVLSQVVSFMAMWFISVVQGPTLMDAIDVQDVAIQT